MGGVRVSRVNSKNYAAPRRWMCEKSVRKSLIMLSKHCRNQKDDLSDQRLVLARTRLRATEHSWRSAKRRRFHFKILNSKSRHKPIAFYFLFDNDNDVAAAGRATCRMSDRVRGDRGESAQMQRVT